MPGAGGTSGAGRMSHDPGFRPAAARGEPPRRSPRGRGRLALLRRAGGLRRGTPPGRREGGAGRAAGRRRGAARGGRRPARAARPDGRPHGRAGPRAAVVGPRGSRRRGGPGRDGAVASAHAAHAAHGRSDRWGDRRLSGTRSPGRAQGRRPARGARGRRQRVRPAHERSGPARRGGRRAPRRAPAAGHHGRAPWRRTRAHGNGSDAPSFAPRAPVATRVATGRPVFRWTAHPDARAYEVAVFDQDDRQRASSGALTGTEWQPPQALAAGRVYLWQVTARTGRGRVTVPAPPASEARFEVADAAVLAEVARLRAAAPSSHLVATLAFVEQGLLDDAEVELRALADENHDSPQVARLLLTLRSLRARTRDPPPDRQLPRPPYDRRAHASPRSAARCSSCWPRPRSSAPPTTRSWRTTSARRPTSRRGSDGWRRTARSSRPPWADEIAVAARVHYLAGRYEPARDGFTLAVRIGEITGDAESRIRGLEGLGRSRPFPGPVPRRRFPSWSARCARRRRRRTEGGGTDPGRDRWRAAHARRARGGARPVAAAGRDRRAPRGHERDRPCPQRPAARTGRARPMRRSDPPPRGRPAANRGGGRHQGRREQLHEPRPSATARSATTRAALEAYGHVLRIVEEERRPLRAGACPSTTSATCTRSLGAPRLRARLLPSQLVPSPTRPAKDCSETLADEGGCCSSRGGCRRRGRPWSARWRADRPPTTRHRSPGPPQTWPRCTGASGSARVPESCWTTPSRPPSAPRSCRSSPARAGRSPAFGSRRDSLRRPSAGRSARRRRPAAPACREELWPALLVAGRAHRALAQPDQAEAALRQAVDVIEEMRAHAVGPEAGRAAFLVARSAPYQELVGLLADGGRHVGRARRRGAQQGPRAARRAGRAAARPSAGPCARTRRAEERAPGERAPHRQPGAARAAAAARTRRGARGSGSRPAERAPAGPRGLPRPAVRGASRAARAARRVARARRARTCGSSSATDGRCCSNTCSPDRGPISSSLRAGPSGEPALTVHRLPTASARARTHGAATSASGSPRRDLEFAPLAARLHPACWARRRRPDGAPARRWSCPTGRSGSCPSRRCGPRAGAT